MGSNSSALPFFCGVKMSNIQLTWLSGFLGVIEPLIVHWIVSENLTRKEKSIIAILNLAPFGDGLSIER